MRLPEGLKSFMIRLAVFVQYRRVTDTQPPTQQATQPRCRSIYRAYYVARVKCVNDQRSSSLPSAQLHLGTTSIVTGSMTGRGKLPLLDLLTGQKSGFSPRRGDSLNRFRSNLAGPTGTWVRLVVQNFTWIGADGWECGPQNIKNFHILVKSRPAGATPSTDFQNV